MGQPDLPEGFDINDPAFLVKGMPRKEFAELRRVAPIWWQSQPFHRDGFEDEGHWVLTRHADVKEVSRNDAQFSTWENTAIIRFNSDMERDQIDMQRVILLNIDPPQHTRMRQIISRGFTPRAVNSLKEGLAKRAEAIALEAAARRPASSCATSPANFRCRRSPICSACRRRTGARSSTGPTRWSATTIRTSTVTRS